MKAIHLAAYGNPAQKLKDRQEFRNRKRPVGSQVVTPRTGFSHHGIYVGRGTVVLSNNCEHFCEWCLQDEQRSYQVERLPRHRSLRAASQPWGLPRISALHPRPSTSPRVLCDPGQAQ